MVVEMGHQMKDLHTLLHYLPIIRNLHFHTTSDRSLGGCINTDRVLAQFGIRETVWPPAMGQIRRMLSQRFKSSAPPLEQSGREQRDGRATMGTRRHCERRSPSWDDVYSRIFTSGSL